MNSRRFVALGDLIADLYYNGNKLIGIDGGSSRFNVIANLAHMKCKNAVIGGCGNDKIGRLILKRFKSLGVDTSEVIFRDKATRAYHLIVNKNMLPKITYKCSKSSPRNGTTTWYEDNLDDIEYLQSKVTREDVIVLDKLDEFSLKIINTFDCDKVLDIGNSNELEKLKDNEILKLKGKIEILQLNKRVVPYLTKRLKCDDFSEICRIFQPKLMIVTRDKDGADFFYNERTIRKKLINYTEEIDATGAGDAFLSVFIKEYYNNSKNIDKKFINRTFLKASNLTSTVVKYVGARGHLYAKNLEQSKLNDTKEFEEEQEL